MQRPGRRSPQVGGIRPMPGADTCLLTWAPGPVYTHLARSAAAPRAGAWQVRLSHRAVGLRADALRVSSLKEAARMPAKTKKKSTFKLTYATMFDPPEELHSRFDAQLAKTRAALGQEYGMIIDGKEVKAAEKFEHRSPDQYRLAAGASSRRATPMTPAPPWPPHAKPSPSGPHTLAGARAADAQGRRPDRQAHLRVRRGDVARGGQEPHGGAGGCRRNRPI